MKVLKFGGTSVGSSDAIKQLKVIVEEESKATPIAVVVSAFVGITDKLSVIATTATENLDEAQRLTEDLHDRHIKIYKELLGDSDTGPFLADLVSSLKDVIQGVSLLQELTKKVEDFILTLGELFSSYIIYSYLEKAMPVTLYNAKDYLVTSVKDEIVRVDLEKSAQKMEAIGERSQVSIFPGFIASKEDGTTTSLGRGGSDYTASILANLFDARELQIWTDVDGLMSANPKLVRQAKVLPHLSYEEALELSHFGAKVIYPPAIQPALAKGIPIKIKNTFNAKYEGTLITKEWDENKTLIRGISSIPSIVLINMTGAGMVGIPSFSSRFFRALADSKVSVIMITQASSEHSICVAINETELEGAKRGLESEFQTELDRKVINAIEVEKGLAIVALVGSKMKDQVGISGKMFHTLGRNGISVKAIAQGSSERNISTVISKIDLRKALNTLHESFFLSELRRINLFVVGVGNVGSSLISQLQAQERYMLDEHNTKITIVGLSNSRKMIFSDEGLDLSKWKKLINDGEDFEADRFLDRMKELNLRNSVFIDNTASEEIARLYERVLGSSISVVTPNKIAAAAAYSDYRRLLDLSLKNNVPFLFETNVAAGLPVLSTLEGLMKSGDKIKRIEAVLSGTLNYLFNTYDGTIPFVEVIRAAKEKGLTEPDPRLDLFGEDVKRKILILARESGHKIEIEEVLFEPFLPQSCMEADDLEAFYHEVSENEAYFKKIYSRAVSEKAKVRVVASLERGSARVGLQYVANDHPFYQLESKDNIVLFYTMRYSDNPLVIKGAGAGAEVTASGIFADILKVNAD